MRNKQELIERWGPIYEGDKDDISEMRALYLDPVRNAKFDFTASYSLDLSGMGKFEYLLNKDVKLFKKYLKESVLVYQGLFENFEKGKPVHGSYVSMLSYHTLFEALATGDMALAKEFAQHLGGRKEIEEENDVQFVINFGYTLKYFVEDAEYDLKKLWADKFLNFCKEDKKVSTFLGYGIVFEAILDKELEKANLGFKEIIQGHENECKARGSDRHFQGRPDEDICVWGIGLANLARYRGLNVQIDHPLIPNELLIDVTKS